MIVTLQAAVHLGNDYWENLFSQPKKATRKSKTIVRCDNEQTEIQGISMINWQENSWKRTTLMTDRAELGYQQRKPTYSLNSVCAWAEPVKIP